MPTGVLKGTRALLRGMAFAADAADRLAFAEVLANNETWSAPMEEVRRRAVPCQLERHVSAQGTCRG